MEEPGKRVSRAFLFNLLGLIANKGLVFIALLLVSRILGPEDYGKASIIVNTTSLFASLAALNLGLIATKYIAQYRMKDCARLSRILALTSLIGLISGLAFALILFIFSQPIAAHQLGSADMATYLQIGSVTVAFTTYNGIQRGVVTGLEKFKLLMTIDAFTGIITFLLGVIGTYLYGVLGYITTLMIAAISTNLVYFIAVQKALRKEGVRYDFRGCHKEKGIFSGFALPMSLATIIAAPANWICGIIIINTFDGYTSYGIYSAAFQWRSIITLAMSTFGNAMLPILVSSNESDERIEKLNLLTEWLASIVIACFLVPISGYLFILYGAKYDQGIFAGCFIAIVFSCIVAGYMDGINRKMVQHEKMWYSFAANAIWALAFIALTYFLRQMGAIGIAYAMVCAYGIMLIVVIAMSIRLKVIDITLIINFKTTVLWLLIGLWCVLVSFCSLFAVQIIASIVVLITVVVVFGAIRQKN